MANRPTFNAELTPQQLANLRRLAKHSGFIMRAGKREGDDSLRQFLIALSDAVERQGVKQVAACLSNVISPQHGAEYTTASPAL